jgi:1-acyl-sn-glycerol-3-phosphate acyltransferase
MQPDGIGQGDRRQGTEAWEEQFQRNARVFEELGLDGTSARRLVNSFVIRARHTPPSSAAQAFDDPSLLGEVSLLSEADPEGRAFMLRLLSPIMSQVEIRGSENLQPLAGLVGKVPITLVSNHISHLDAPAIFWALWNAPAPGPDLAERLLFLVGLFVSRSQFARVGLSLFSSLLVCSPRDINERNELRHLMARINHRAFREARGLQAAGRVLAFFPEGTRSPDGQRQPFLGSLYRYLAETIVIPVRLDNLHGLLPNSGLVLQKASASVNIGQPVVVGDLPGVSVAIPDSLQRIPGVGKERTRQSAMDELAEQVAAPLHDRPKASGP